MGALFAIPCVIGCAFSVARRSHRFLEKHTWNGPIVKRLCELAIAIGIVALLEFGAFNQRMIADIELAPVLWLARFVEFSLGVFIIWLQYFRPILKRSET